MESRVSELLDAESHCKRAGNSGVGGRAGGCAISGGAALRPLQQRQTSPRTQEGEMVNPSPGYPAHENRTISAELLEAKYNELSEFVRGQPQGLSNEEIRSALKYFVELDEYLRTRTVEEVQVIERIRNIRADLHGLADTYVSRIPGNLASERLLQWFIDYTTNARVEGMNKILRQNASTFSIANEKQHLINLGYPVWLADIAARYQDFKNNWRWIGEGS